MDETPKDSRDVPVQAFVKGMTPDDVRPSVVEVPASEYQPQQDPDADSVSDPGDGSTPVASGKGLASTAAQGPGGAAGEALAPGQKWPVDALLGQINGKPLYANDFLASREDRIRQLVAQPDRVAAYRQLLQLLDEAFEQFVNNQLVISEAEGAIPIEAKEGLLAWMRELQEAEIANRGGTRSEAQRSIEEEFPGTTIEEFMQRQKNEILASDLMRRRIKPRAIVSWRDIERLYMKNWEKYNPLPTIRVGRIALLKTDQAKVDRVKGLFAQGKSFAEVAAELQWPQGHRRDPRSGRRPEGPPEGPEGGCGGWAGGAEVAGVVDDAAALRAGQAHEHLRQPPAAEPSAAARGRAVRHGAVPLPAESAFALDRRGPDRDEEAAHPVRAGALLAAAHALSRVSHRRR
jgi:hypothetical protein